MTLVRGNETWHLAAAISTKLYSDDDIRTVILRSSSALIITPSQPPTLREAGTIRTSICSRASESSWMG